MKEVFWDDTIGYRKSTAVHLRGYDHNNFAIATITKQEEIRDPVIPYNPYAKYFGPKKKIAPFAWQVNDPDTARLRGMGTANTLEEAKARVKRFLGNEVSIAPYSQEKWDQYLKR